MKKLISIILILGLFLIWTNPVFAANTHSIDLELGSSQYLSITDGSQTGLDITGDITIEAWVKLESLPSSGTVYEIVSRWGNPYAFHFQYYNNGSVYQFQFQYRDSSNNTTNGAYNLTLDTGVWYHLAVVADVSVPDITYYIDTDPNSATMLASNATSIRNTTVDFMIGARPEGPSGFFDGLIDDVRVWNDIRTSTEISDNYQTELVGDEANLQGYWKLNNSLLDETSNNNDLTNNNSAVFSTDVPFEDAGASAVLPEDIIFFQ